VPATDWIPLTVTQITAPSPGIRSLVLARNGEMLPGWEAGAHVMLRLPNGDARAYSLVNLSTAPAATRAPTQYRLGVRLETASKGGSAFVHGLGVGDVVSVSPPVNDFPLDDHHGETVLLAGGIGVTPITAMVATLGAQGRHFRLHYLARSEADMAFRSELRAIAGERFLPHFDDRDGVFDLASLMRGMTDGQPLYLCGPRPLIDAAIGLAEALGWAAGRLRFELFAAAAPQTGDRAFELELRASGRTLTVEAGQTIVAAMLEAGLDPLYDCQRGDCGICQATVLEGVPDHRDTVLSAAERAAGRLIQICVSRAASPRLVLDL